MVIYQIKLAFDLDGTPAVTKSTLIDVGAQHSAFETHQVCRNVLDKDKWEAFVLVILKIFISFFGAIHLDITVIHMFR